MYSRSPQPPSPYSHANILPPQRQLYAQQYYQQQPQPPANYPYPQQQQFQPPPQRHKGTLAPGQLVSVGDQQVRIERYLSEGGYAHVYLTTSERPIYTPSKNPDKKGRWGEKGYTQHCLKRIAFQDDHVWVDVKKEIEVMRSLPPNPHLVQYLGHSHARLPTGDHEVFILMEFCSGGGIIDLLNKRLRDRLKEIEILNIFTDVCEAVAAMHALKRPLLHRDLKIENVLSQPLSSPPTPQRPTPLMFKLCDFGSTTFPTDRPPQTKLEADALAMDLNKNTTLQYRSPEMVEPMLGLPVGLPSDVWALGCLLYKLCYYTTPFEEHGPLAIVNAKYTFPPMPQYSPRLQHLIASMLVEQPVRRPTVFEVLRMSHEMSGTRPEVDYPMPSRSIPQHAPRPKPQSSANNLLDMSDSTSRRTPAMQPSMVPSVHPQRRGRPTREGGAKPTTPSAAPPQPSPSWQYAPKDQQPQPTRPQPTSSAALVKPTPKVQITGDNLHSFPRTAPSSAISKSPSPVDAFGMPALASQKTTSSGFGDAFGVPSSGVRGMQTGASQNATRFGQGVPSKKPSGFSDSFSNTSTLSRSASVSSRPSVSRLPSGPRPPSAASAASAASIRTTRQQLTSSPAPILPSQQTSQPSSQPSPIPEGDLSFETRYPSVETLDSEDNFSPPAPGAERLISPMVSPPLSLPTGASASTISSKTTQSTAHNAARPSQPRLFTRPSLMGNLTGGDLKSPPVSENKDDLSRGQAQARSTHVTGTAFRDQTSPAPTQPANQAPQGAEVDYFGPLGSDDEKEPEEKHQPAAEKVETLEEKEREVKPKNLMDDEDPSLLQIPLLPGRSTSPLSSSSRSSSGKPASLKVDAVGAAQATGRSNIMSEEWSPLEDMRRKDAEERAKARERAEQDRRDDHAGTVRERSRSDDPEVDSSDEDEGPEEPNRFNRPLPPPKSPVEPPRPTTQRVPSEDRTRPQSMFLPSTNSYSRPSTVSPVAGQANSPSFAASPPNTSVSQLSAGATDRSGHGRKDSINGLVSRYEGLKVSGNTTVTGREASRRPLSQYGAPPAVDAPQSANSLSRKPSVASKPFALRKSTAEVGRSQPSTSPTKPSQAAPVSPVKPKTATPAKPVAENSAYSGSTYVRPGMTRPVVKPKPTLNTTINQSKTSSSPIVRAPPAREQGSGGRADDRLAQSSSGSQSPEKQQPVNALIQRWNKGEVNNSSANIPKVNRGGYI
ncbi:hypothetical protein IAR50_001253 [Cryptococcus sp. DSM 104548]